MLELRLHLRIKDADHIRLAIGRLERLVFALCAVGALIAMLLLVQFTILGVIMTLLFVAGACYEESWTYQNEAAFFERRLGLLFLYSRKLVRRAEVRAIAVTTTATLTKTSTTSLSLRLSDGREILIDRQRRRHRDELAAAAKAFAETSHLPVEEA